MDLGLPKFNLQPAKRSSLFDAILTGIGAGQSIQKFPVEMAKTQADTDRANTLSKYLPLQRLIEAQNSLRSSSRFGSAFQLAKGLQELDPSTRATWISEHQSDYNDMLQNLANG